MPFQMRLFLSLNRMSVTADTFPKQNGLQVQRSLRATPRKGGWSLPRVPEGTRARSSGRCLGGATTCTHMASPEKTGGIGYSPACANERTRRCPRWTRTNRGIKCADCPARKFIPSNDQAIVEHFKGEQDGFRDVMGLYVLLPDCTTWVLVADFDKEGWQRETTLYRDACRSFGLCPAVERSRSGNGAHVWLFFEELVDAELARNLGCALITHAMSHLLIQITLCARSRRLA